MLNKHFKSRPVLANYAYFGPISTRYPQYRSRLSGRAAGRSHDALIQKCLCSLNADHTLHY